MEEYLTVNIFDGESLIAAGVLVRLVTHRGGRSGEGDFPYPAGASVGLNRNYRLVSDDGWEGTVMVSGIEMGSHQGTLVKFLTNGKFGRF